MGREGRFVGTCECSSPFGGRHFFRRAAARPGIATSVVDVAVDRPHECAGLPGGFFLRCDLMHDVQIATEFSGEHFRTSFHGTCLEVVHRLLTRGIEVGWSVNNDSGRELRGIWSLAPERARLLTSYTLYSMLDASGYLYGPLLELRSPWQDPQGRPVALRRRGSTNRTQWLSYPDSTTMVRLWIHIIHISQLATMPVDSGLSIFAEPAFSMRSKFIQTTVGSSS